MFKGRVGDAAAVGYSEWNNNLKWEKGGAGSALLIGAALALFARDVTKAEPGYAGGVQDTESL